MKRIYKFILISSAIVIFTTLSVTAQTTRVYVADSGNDANLCTKSSECRSITKALSVVDDGGEVIITESGDYDTFSVTKSVTVAAAPGVDAEIVSTVQYAIFIQIGLPQVIDKIVIRNLNLKNISTLTSPKGIFNGSGVNLFVDGCSFTGFGVGINEGGTPGRLFVHDSTFRNNEIGIALNTPFTEGSIIGVIDNCKIEQSSIGIVVPGKSFATIRNSILADNPGTAIKITSPTATYKAEAIIDNCQITGNVSGVKIGGSLGPSFARISRSTISGNSTGVWVASMGTFSTFQNNVIISNTIDINGGINPQPMK